MAAGFPRDNILICGVNWIGDAVMSMPALTLYRRRHPDNRVALLVKPAVAPLWSLYDAGLEIILLRTGWKGTRDTVHELRERRFDRAHILPQSFRSAWVPWLAGIPRRVGRPAGVRTPLLTDRIPLLPGQSTLHQSFEYPTLLGCSLASGEDLPAVRLRPPPRERVAMRALLGALPAPRIGLMPGAARGPSKRWPEAHFAALARGMATAWGGSIVLLGAETDRGLCGRIAASAGVASENLAGRTSLAEWSAALTCCDAVVANDSGGMHLTAALGIPVVALFGITDPVRTGPRGGPCRILQHAAQGARDIPRRSERAAAALAAITPEEVLETLREFLPARVPV